MNSIKKILNFKTVLFKNKTRKLIISVSGLIIIMNPSFSAFAQSIIREDFNEIEQSRYNYKSVCEYINDKINKIEYNIENNRKIHPSIVPTPSQGDIKLYAYNYNGTYVKYISLPSKNLVILARFEKKKLPKNERSKNDLLVGMGIKNPEEIQSDISLACDAMTMRIAIQNGALEYIEVSTNFVD